MSSDFADLVDLAQGVAAFQAAEIERWRGVVRAAGLQLEG